MRRVLFLLVLAIVAGWGLYTQWISLGRYGERRFRAAARPGKGIVVGVCWPFAANNDDMADGVTLAQEELTTRGGVDGRSFRFIFRDYQSSEAANRRVAMEFASNPDVTAVMGYYDDDPAVRASAIYEESKLLHIMIGANNTFMTKHGFKYILRTVLPSDVIGRKLARAVDKYGYGKCAIIWEDDAFGEDLAYQFEAGLRNDTVVMKRTYTQAAPEFREIVNDIKVANPDLVFFAGLEPWAGEFLRRARQMDLKTPVMGAFSDTPAMHRSAGPALEGAVFFDFYDPDSPSPENQAFVAKFRARFGRAPATYAAQAYDAVMLLAAAVAKTNSANPLELSYALRFADTWAGANGLYRFTASGEIMDKPLYLKQFRDGSVGVLRSVAIPMLSDPYP